MKKILSKFLITTLAILFWCSPPILIKTETAIAQESMIVTTKAPEKTFKKFKRYVAKTKVSVHSEPRKNSVVLLTYPKGKKLTIYAVEGNWYKVSKGKWIHKDHVCKKDPIPSYNGVHLKYSEPYNITKNHLTRSRGICYYNGYKETWYSSKEYGQTQTAYHIPEKHLAKDGTYRDKDGYICIAAPRRFAKGKIFMTSLGPAKVYDRGVSGNVLDIYTNW